MTENRCRNVFYFASNNCWYCDTSMLPVEEDCRMACFTDPTSIKDRAVELFDELMDRRCEDDWDDGWSEEVGG